MTGTGAVPVATVWTASSLNVPASKMLRRRTSVAPFSAVAVSACDGPRAKPPAARTAPKASGTSFEA